MKEYVLNFGLNFLVALTTAILTFLVSMEVGVIAVAASCTAGVVGGLFSAVAYTAGRMNGGLELDWTLVGVTALAAVAGGLIGGLGMML